MHYLDHAASSPLRPEAVDAMRRVQHLAGNPSSLHAAGRRARRLVEESRERIAASLGVEPSWVVLTSGGTEADNLAVKGLARASGRRRVLVSAVEHPAVLRSAESLTAEGFEVQELPVDRGGRLDLAAAGDLLADDVALVSVMWVNNETGTVQPVAEVAHACRRFGIPVHTDAVQAVDRVGLGLTPVAAATVSAHKTGGPVGIGALLVDPGVPLAPQQHGGPQERERRAGTLNVLGAVGFAAALEAPAPDLTALDARVREGLRAVLPEARLWGGEPGAPGICLFTVPGCAGDDLAMLLDADGVQVSTGSACTAGIPQPSHVLLAMGADRVTASSGIRVSLGWNSTASDVEALLAALPDAVERARRVGGAA